MFIRINNIYKLQQRQRVTPQQDTLDGLLGGANLGIIPSVKQVEMTVVVPIHPSSLEYFDYVVCYSDNRGTLARDTIHYVRFSDDDQTNGNLDNCCYTRTLSYNDLPVTSTITVEMIPVKERSSMVSFNFYTPKPCIFPNVHYSTTSVRERHFIVLWMDLNKLG